MLTLKNKTVLITRPKNQSEEFVLKLKKLGAIPLVFPLIELEAVDQSELKKNFFNNKFDWIIFTSYNAVEYFFKTINPQAVHSKIAVVGTKTEEILSHYDRKADFIPSNFTAETLAKEIPISTNENVFIPQSELAKNTLAEMLTMRGTNPFSVTIYRNNKVKYEPKEVKKFFCKKIDFVTFTSGSTIKAFVDLKIELRESKVICIGPKTAKIATSNNLKVDAIAQPYTTDGMINTIISFYQ